MDIKNTNGNTVWATEKETAKHYKIKPITEENYEDVLEMAKEKVLEWASY